jgi:hypothetical protein
MATAEQVQLTLIGLNIGRHKALKETGSPVASQLLLRRLYDWAIALEQARLVKLSTFHGKNGILTLLPV